MARASRFWLKVKGKAARAFCSSIACVTAASLDLIFLPRQVDLQRRVALELGLLEPDLAGIDLEPRAAKDDLLGLLGQVLGAVHLLELAQLFLGVLEVFAGLT